MKKLICLALASAMLCACVPAALAEDKELALDPASTLYIEDGFIENMRENCTAAELIAEFADRGSITVTDKDGKALALSDKVGAATVSNGSDSVRTYLPGDANSDSAVSTKDVSFLLKKQAGFGVEIDERPSDVNYDGTVNAKDIAQIMKHLALWDVSLAREYKGNAAENEDAGIDWCFDSVMNRVGRSDTTLSGTKDYVARMAKNEHEDVQLLVTSDADRTGLTLEVGQLTNAAGCALEYEFLYGYYYEFGMLKQLKGANGGADNTVEDYFVEPLPEYRGEAFDIAKDNSKTFVMRVYAGAEAEAGLYKADAILKDSDGKSVKQMTFRVFVWDFALPEKPASDTAFSLSYYSIITNQKNLGDFTTDDVREVKERWYEYLLDQRISPYHLPVDITDPEADKWMSDPRVTSFCTNGGGQYNGESAISKEAFQAIYKKLATNEDWLYKAYVYTLDEPWEGGVAWAKDQYEWAHEWVPDTDIHIVIPMGGNQIRSWNGEERMDIPEYVLKYSDILCPQSGFFTNYYSLAQIKADRSLKPAGTTMVTDKGIFEKYGQFRDRWAKWREDGDKRLWWYVCCGPTMPHANFFRYYQGVDTRVLMWQQYMFDVDGLLYYSTIRWDQVNKRKLYCDGDGLLLYTGTIFGQESYPVSSVRLEQVRDGFEDYDYLKLLEGCLGREKVMDYVDRITTDILYFTEDYELLDSVRDEVGFLLESLGTK